MTPGRRAENPRMSGEIGPSAAVVGEAERVLRRNWRVGERDGVPYAYSQPSPGRYPWQWYWDSCFAAIVWRRFEPARARAELESLLAAQRPDGFIGHTIFWAQKVSPDPLALLQRHLAQRLPDRDDPAAAAGLGLADRGWRPGRGAADRPPHGLARRQPRSRGRRAALDPAAGRVRARRLAEVRTGLGLALERPPRLPAAGPAQPQARVRRAPGPRRRPPRPLRTAGQHDVVALAAGHGPALGDTGAGGAALGRAPRTLHRRGPAGWGAARRRHLGGAGAAGTSGPAGGDRPPAGRGAPAERARVPHRGRPALGRGLGAELRARRRPRPDPPLLARPDLGQLGLDGVAGPAPARLRGGGPAPRRRRHRRGRPRRPARVLRPAHRQGPGRKGLRLVSAGCRARIRIQG